MQGMKNAVTIKTDLHFKIQLKIHGIFALINAMYNTAKFVA